MSLSVVLQELKILFKAQHEKQRNEEKQFYKESSSWKLKQDECNKASRIRSKKEECSDILMIEYALTHSYCLYVLMHVFSYKICSETLLLFVLIHIICSDSVMLTFVV